MARFEQPMKYFPTDPRLHRAFQILSDHIPHELIEEPAERISAALKEYMEAEKKIEEIRQDEDTWTAIAWCATYVHADSPFEFLGPQLPRPWECNRW